MGAGKTIARLVGYGIGIALTIMGLLCLVGGLAAKWEDLTSGGC